jgi:hypothetical protein
LAPSTSTIKYAYITGEWGTSPPLCRINRYTDHHLEITSTEVGSIIERLTYNWILALCKFDKSIKIPEYNGTDIILD